MPNIASAAKRVRQIATRTVRDKSVKSRVKTARKRFADAVAEGDSEKAKKAYDNLASTADRAAKGNVIHKNSASRLKSEAAQVLAKVGS